MSNNNHEFVDDRARQDTLIKRPERAEPETRVDRGASEDFADDRQEIEESNDSEQSALSIDEVGNGQVDLTGETAGRNPEWSE